MNENRSDGCQNTEQHGKDDYKVKFLFVGGNKGDESLQYLEVDNITTANPLFLHGSVCYLLDENVFGVLNLSQEKAV